MQDLSRLTATEAVRLINAGRLRAEALMEACLARIAERETQVRAFSWFQADAARRAAASARPGPLHGLPIGVKDVIETADMPTEHGSAIWRGWRPRADAASVAWAKERGGVILGKTVTTEFATQRPGPTANPHRLSHTPGGSSSGSAAAVADYFVPLAFGTQTGGSVIRPAAYCGVVGFKPSFGLINRTGMKVMSDSLDTIGVMARSVADCALFAGAVAGSILAIRMKSRAARPASGFAARQAGTRHCLKRRRCSTVSRRRSPGPGQASQRANCPQPYARLATAHPIVMCRESARAMGGNSPITVASISEMLLERLDFGLAQSDEAIADAYAVFAAAQRGFPAVTEGFDVLVTPSAPGQAPEGLGRTGDAAFNFTWTSLHVPCVTVPAGTGPDGLPLGIQIVGRQGEDRQTLAWAQYVANVVAG